MIKNSEDNSLKTLLSSFLCERDKDIENFIHNRAIEFEELSKARTYLILNKDEVINNNDLKIINIYGYISLAMSVISVPENASNHIRKDIDGYSAKIHGEVINNFPCYLIGQLSRNDKFDNKILSGDEIMEIAISIIMSANELIGGRSVLVECKNNDKILDFYRKNYFRDFNMIEDKDGSLVQLLRKI